MKLYFETKHSEHCYSEDYFEEGQEVFEAVPEKILGIFWCKKDCEVWEKDIHYNPCGKNCKNYSPRNGKSGCCKHYSNIVYSQGKKVIL